MFILALPDNELLFFRGQPGAVRCPTCKQLLGKRSQDLASVAIKRRPTAPISISVDGVCVVSADTRHSLEATLGAQLAFSPLAQGLFTMTPTLVVPFDALRRRTRFGKRCEVCGEYDSITGATPIMLSGEVPSDRVARTDLEFGSDDEKAPLLIAGDGAAQVISALGITGLTLVRQ